jgi:hypothetical protein
MDSGWVMGGLEGRRGAEDVSAAFPLFVPS